MNNLRGLYAITDSQLLADGKLLPYAEAALKGGARLLQYRDKSSDAARRLFEAQALQDLCARHGASLIINDDARFALPLTAIGGLSLDNAPALIAHGANLIAVIHALFAADSAAAVQARARAFSNLFNTH